MTTQPDQLDGVELLACPFCNCARCTSVGKRLFDEMCFAVMCESCEAHSAWRRAPEDATKDWNRRSPDLTQPLTQSVALARDAARYRFLTNLPKVQAQAFFWNWDSRKERAKAIDAAIDRALAEEKQRG